ncbi:lactonase [Leptospira vanthielii]|uniref:Lactonase n=1 Tax=Leptospira vanthielii TaxID=293085 RepID=A0ABY2NR68_9LEPT|nr:lactonase [Leptospira vanthielii]TGM58262.1 lactonase [Leptospira vanthielii]
MKKLPYLLLVLCFGCTQYLLPNFKFNRAWYLALGGIGISADDGELPAPIDIVAQPTLALPTGSIFDSPDLSVSVNTSSVAVPAQIGGLNVPIGKVYDIDLKAKLSEDIEPSSIKTVVFSEPVVLEYSYNKEELESAGFLEEFQVFYFSQISNQWEPLSDIVVDQEKGKILAKTDHFTPFILTAVPKLTGTGVATAPACLSTEMPISGSSGAVWTQIDEHFKYYKDRNYTLNSNSDFMDLQFSGAVAIATCNGGNPAPDTQNCGPFPQHKYNNGSEYIKFTASEDITVYVMYDSRGSQDASWFASDSWVLTDKQISTTDGVGYYKVYQKQFLKNDVVTMHGNRQGIPPNAGVETNYWVVVKPKTLYTSSCLSSISTSSYNVVSPEVTLTIPGSERATFLWKDYSNDRLENIIVRRKKNFPPTSMEDGVAPNVTEIGNFGFSDTGLDPNSTYYYAFFGRSSEGLYSLPAIYKIDTGADTDGDGITDAFEANTNCFYRTWHSYNCNSNSNVSDSDSDGIDDLTELIHNTKIDSNDTSPPIISKFELITKSTTSFPNAIFTFESSDTITPTYKWTMTQTNKKPNPGFVWLDVRTDRLLESPSLTAILQDSRDFFLWIRDDAGNISSPAGPIHVSRSGNVRPSIVASSSNSNIIKFDFIPIWSVWKLLPDSIYENFGIYNQPSQTFGYVWNQAEKFSKIQFGKIPNILYAQSHNPTTGYNINVIDLNHGMFSSPTIIQRIPNTNMDTFTISEDGRNLYVMNLNINLQPLYQRISLYRIQPDGTLVFDKLSGPVNQIKYDRLIPGKNQTIYVTNYDYANILRVNGETLDLMPVSLRSYETYNLRFHPSGKFCYQVNPVPSETTRLEKCLVNSSNGDLTFDSNVLTTNNKHIFFEISSDGNYMVIFIHDGYSNSNSAMILYKIDQNTGNITEKDRIENVDFKPYSEFRIDPSSQFIIFKRKDDKMITYLLNQNTEKIHTTSSPFLSDLGYYFDIQYLDNSTYAVQTNITHSNQPGFVHGVNDVKYPLPFTSLVGDYPYGYLLSRAFFYNPIQIGVQNTDLGYMSCGKQLSDYEETIDVNNELGQNRILNTSGNIWNRTISLQSLAAENSLSGRYKLEDTSSSCRPNQAQQYVDINIKRKRLTRVTTDLKLPVGQKPNDIDTYTNVVHYESKGNVIPFVSHVTTCTYHEYGCNFIKIDKPAKVFYCEWHSSSKVFYYYKSRNQCYQREKNVPRLFHLSLITNVEHSVQSTWRWDKYQITDP